MKTVGGRALPGASDALVGQAKRAFFDHVGKEPTVVSCETCFRAWWVPWGLPKKEAMCARGRKLHARWWELEES